MLVKCYRDLQVWQKSFEAGMNVFVATKRFPREEMFSLTDQLRRSSRAVSANIAEAWEHTRYEAMFVSKLTRAAGEAAESQNWLDYSIRCEYLAEEEGISIRDQYGPILRALHGMIDHSSQWCKPSVSGSGIKNQTSGIIP